MSHEWPRDRLVRCSHLAPGSAGDPSLGREALPIGDRGTDFFDYRIDDPVG